MGLLSLFKKTEPQNNPASAQRGPEFSFEFNPALRLVFLLAFLMFVAAFAVYWQESPIKFWLTGLITITLLGFLFAFFTLANKGRSYFFIVNGFYIVALITLLQISQQESKHLVAMIYWWALALLPFAVLTKKISLMMTALWLALFWFFLETGKHNFPISFPIFIFAAGFVLLKGKYSFSLFLSTLFSIAYWMSLALAEYWREADLPLRLNIEVGVIMLAVYLLCFFLSHWLQSLKVEKIQELGKVLQLLFLRFGLLVLMVLCSRYPWWKLLSSPWNHQQEMFIILALIALLALLFAWLEKLIKPFLAIMLIFAVMLVAVLLSKDSNHAVYFHVFANIAIIPVFIFLFYKNIKNNELSNTKATIIGVAMAALMVFINIVGHAAIGVLFAVIFAIIFLAMLISRENKKPENSSF